VTSTLESAQLDEESKGLLRRIVERTAYRQLMAANIRGHGLKYLSSVEDKRVVAGDLDASLRAMSGIDSLYVRIGGSELSIAVRDMMEKIPYPYSRLELAVCLALVDRTERLVAESYLESRSQEMAAIARALVETERPGTRMLEAQLADFCSETGNRPTAQQFVNRWLAIAVVAFGRPGSPGDQRAVALGLRSRRVSDMVRRFLDETKPFLESSHLVLPATSSLGLEFGA